MNEETRAISFILDPCGRQPRLEHALEIERILEWSRATGARLLYPGHPEFPFCSPPLESTPPLLTVWGESPWLAREAIAVVGSREPSDVALRWMEEHLPRFLSATGALVVSGGARGIDQKAHALALRAGLPTVVFLPSGLGCPYPPEWIDWKEEVIRMGGAIVSTYPPFSTIRKRNFEGRNRLIAAMGRLCLIIEARRQSGSAMTARLARELGHRVACLPGPVGDPLCAGTNDLIYDGATMIRDYEDLRVAFDLERGV